MKVDEESLCFVIDLHKELQENKGGTSHFVQQHKEMLTRCGGACTRS